MLLNFFYSNTYRGAFDGLCKCLKANQSSGKSNIIIVPDRFSLTIEKAILDKLGIAGSMDNEVVSFSRLAALLLGNRIAACLSPESAVMLLAKVIRENKDSLSCYSKVKDITAFSKDMYAAISEIRNNCITVEALRAAQANIKNTGINKKTADIILLYDKYINELYNKYNDATTRLHKLTEEIPFNTKIANSHIYITDFYSFKNTEYQIIEKLISKAISVNVALIKSNYNSSNRRIYPYYRIKSIGEQLKAEIKGNYSHYKLNKVNTIIEQQLFAYDSKEVSDSEGKISLYHSIDIENEIIFVAREIKKLIREGDRYRDIAIVCGDISDYTPYIESIFHRFQIPYYIDTKELLANHPLIRFLFTALDYVNDSHIINYAYELSKNCFTGISDNDSDIFENYCRKYGIKYLTNVFNIDDENKAVAEKVRLRLNNIINMLVDKTDTVRNNIDRIMKLLINIDADKVMNELGKRQNDYFDKVEAEITKQIPNKFNELINEINEILGDVIMPYDEFITVFKAALGNANVSMIPELIDSVFIGEPIESRYAIIKTLFVIGAADGIIPSNRKDTGIITSYDCNEWKVEIFPTVKQSGNLDKFQLHQLLIKPEQKLILSYCSRSIDGDFLSPSTIMKQLERIFGLSIISINDNYEDYGMDDRERAEMFAYKFSTYDNALNEIVTAIRGYKDAKLVNSDMKPYDALFSILDSDKKTEIEELINLHMDTLPVINNSEMLFFGKEKTTSVSRLETYFNCPFKHFVKYGIKAEKRDEAILQPVNIGSIVHKALELFIKRIKDTNPDFVISIATRDLLILDITDEVLKTAEYEYMMDDNIRELLGLSIKRILITVLDTINISKFKPYLIELDFGKSLEYPYIPINYGKGKTINMRGKIDRVDRYLNNIIIIDYKTGTVKDLVTDLKYGNKIQLFIYLSALAKGDIKPSGVLYMQLNDKFIKEKDKSSIYQGKVTENMKDSLDPSIIDGIGKLITNKEGKKSTIITEEKLLALMDYSVKISSKAVEEISNGYIEANSVDCNYCDYIDICHARLMTPKIRKNATCNNDDFETGGSDV